MNRLLVIGFASSDVLHLRDRAVNCAGGAGMYTAMAASRCGAQVTLFGGRPDPCPDNLRPVAQQLRDWTGPIIRPEQLPHFEISYRRGKTQYLKQLLGAEAMLSITMLPTNLSMYDLVHITPLGNGEKQLSFIQACRQHGAKKISAGTGLFIAKEQPQTVRAAIEQTDYFFMNNQEAKSVFGSLESAKTGPGKVLYLTLGAQGANVIQGNKITSIPAVSVTEVDPTGAGDSFCGSALAHLLQKKHPIMAAHYATALATETISQVGPSALLSDETPPEMSLDARAQVNDLQVQKIAQQISTISDVVPFPFVSPVLPSVGHPKAIDYFFAATLQQFSFWSEENGRYEHPLIANINGSLHKGSDYLWAAYKRRLEQDQDFFSPERQANMSREELLEAFRSDSGDDSMPALDLHLEQARSYGRDMLALKRTPQTVLHESLTSAEPLQTFLDLLDQIGGYKEDPLRKKTGLLALILNQRPEKLLPLRTDERVAPVIDYHAMRFCLRIGLIDVLDEQLRQKLIQRQILSPRDEWAVRHSAYRAREQVVTLSGKSEGSVDWFFFGARKRCPEMSEPECHLCQVHPVCSHRKELFQPVLRTTYY